MSCDKISIMKVFSIKYYVLCGVIFTSIILISATNSQESSVQNDIQRLTNLPDFTETEIDINPFDLVSSRENIFVGDNFDVSIVGRDLNLESIKKVKWFINGKEKKDFENAFSYNLKINNSYRPAEIETEIEYIDFFDENKLKTTSLIIVKNPILFDLVWESEGILPPQYKGYPLLAPQQNLKVSAILRYISSDNNIYNEEDFSFFWKVEGRIFPEEKFKEEVLKSGYISTGVGNNTILIPNKITLLENPLTVEVQAKSFIDNAVSFNKKINIYLEKPRILLYEQDLLLGTKTHKLISKNEKTNKNPLPVVIFPFLFSKQNVERGEIDYLWYINQSATPQKNNRKIDISYIGEQQIIDLKLEIVNTADNKYLQFDEYDFSLSF